MQQQMTSANPHFPTATAKCVCWGVCWNSEIALWRDRVAFWTAAVAEGRPEVWPDPHTNNECLRVSRLRLMVAEETL